jgi:hypothetical protein
MESDEVLRESADWSREQLKQVSVLTGLVTSVKKMTGLVPRIPTPSQVMHGSGKTEHDLVRQMAELRVSRRALHDHADEVPVQRRWACESSVVGLLDLKYNKSLLSSSFPCIFVHALRDVRASGVETVVSVSSS